MGSNILLAFYNLVYFIETGLLCGVFIIIIMWASYTLGYSDNSLAKRKRERDEQVENWCSVRYPDFSEALFICF